MKTGPAYCFRLSLFLGLFLLCCFNFAEAAPPDLNIVLISDINDAYGSTSYSPALKTAVSFIEETRPDLVICAGDMVAGQSLKLGIDQLEAMWRAFAENLLAPLQRTGIPFAFTFGNHDGAGSARFAHERLAAKKFWQENRPELSYADGSGFPDYYSFRQGGVFFAVVDASTAKIPVEQQQWLAREMATEQARSARLRVLLGHLPLFAVAEGRNRPGDVVAAGEKHLQNWSALGVDYYISGHHHAFYQGEAGGLKMIFCGALGGGPRRLLGTDKKPVKTLTSLRLGAREKHFQIVTYEVSDKLKEISQTSLPEKIEGSGPSLRRFISFK